MLSGIMKHVDTDEFIHFLNWLIDDSEQMCYGRDAFSASDIVCCVEKPYKYQKYWDEYVEQDEFLKDYEAKQNEYLNKLGGE